MQIIFKYPTCTFFWALLLPGHLAFQLKVPILNSQASRGKLQHSVADNFADFLRDRSLGQLPSWVRLCSSSCWENGGTCNLLEGSCSCPLGRVNDERGARFTRPVGCADAHSNFRCPLTITARGREGMMVPQVVA